MAVTHTTAARNAAANAVVDLLDVGTGTNGTLQLRTSADAAVATNALSATAFGSATGGTATANAIADDTNAAGGTAAKFALRDADDTDVIFGSVTATGGGGDIELSSVDIGAGDTIEITSLAYTVAP